MACPNVNLDSWKLLVSARGEDVAYYLWDRYDGNIPESESKSEIVKAGIKVVNALTNLSQSQEDKRTRKYGEENQPERLTIRLNTKEQPFLEENIRKTLANKGVPKEQIEFVFDYMRNNNIKEISTKELAVSIAGDYSYAVEINTTNISKEGRFIEDEEGNLIREPGTEVTEELEPGDYSDLTVPGGTNYTENEIATPAITPSIKGHAQFATDKGIGWFRSDDKTEKSIDDRIEAGEQMNVFEALSNSAKETKTRRILEVQSDLFQKGRDKENLINTIEKNSASSEETFKDSEGYTYYYSEINNNYFKGIRGEYINLTKEEYLKAKNNGTEIKQNQFLQLLNQGSNWVTFFVKSIIQDSAKKGYEKVLFPSGNTASKVEGHTTLEEFKKQKQDRIEQLEETKSKNIIANKSIVSPFLQSNSFENAQNKIDDEITQLKQELERVEGPEGFGALKPIYNFYENTVKNVLNKQYGRENVKQITDEYGNTWNEITISSERESSKILFQTENMPTSKASPETVAKMKQLADKMGLNMQELSDYAKKTGLDTKGVAGLADLTRKIIAIAEGKEQVALTEEIVHIATAIIEQINPNMITEMIAKIDRFSIYKEVYEAYKDKYLLNNGKPDIRKIKKEAVDKLITEVIINQNEGTTEFPELRSEENQSLIRKWWNAIRDFFSGMYRKSNISLFEEAATKIQEGVGTVADIKGEGVFLQTTTDVQKKVQDALESTKNNINKVVESQKTVDPLLMDSEEATNFYEVKNDKGVWERIKNRVTDRVKAWYAERFPGRTFTAAEKKFNELKRTLGVDGHNDFQEIHERYYNADGTKKDVAQDPPGKFNLQSKDMYDKLERYYTDLIKTFPENTLIFAEKVIYDAKAKEAGTIDFLAIEPSGKANILDWKFMSINKGMDDVAWFKQGAYDVQLGRYKQILQDNYGIKSFGMIRAIPIIMDFKLQNITDPDSSYLSGIAIGSVDTSKIEDIKLLPISESTETTGNEVLDDTIKDLNAALKQIGKEKVTSEEERLLKREELKLVQKAIRLARGKTDLAPLIEVVSAIKSNGDRILNDYNTIYKDKKATDVDATNKILSDFSDEMREYLQLSDVFKDIDRRLGDLIYQEKWRADAKTDEEIKNLDDRKEILTKLRDETDAIHKTNTALTKAKLDFADKHVGQRNLITGLIDNEKVVKGFFSRFRGVSELPMAALNLLYKLTNSAKGKASSEALGEVTQLMTIRENLKKKGGDLRKYVQQIYQKDDKGGLVNKLIHRYSDKFYDKIDEMAELGGDKAWLLSNIDVSKYKADADVIMNQRIERIKGNHPNDKAIQDKMILEEYRRWDITRDDFNGWNRDNYILKRYPNDNWFSSEYNVIRADADLNALYEYIYNMNKKASDIGYITAGVAKTFLPFIRKSTAEGLAWDGTLSAIANWTKNLERSLKINPEDVGYGKYNEFTGELENSIPKYYTYDFTFKAGVNDYSEVSEDIFANMILYTQHVNKYKYMTEVEGQLKVIKDIEQFKDHIKTNKIGDVVIGKDGKPDVEKGNKENAEMYDNFMRALLYEQKYVLSDEDAAFNVGKVTRGVKKAINKVTGKEVFDVTEEASYSSMVKTIDAANRAFQLKTLGLEFISGAVNWFGGNIQAITQAGNYFKGRELAANQLMLMTQKFTTSEEKDAFVELVNTFMPLKEDPSYELYKQAGMSKLTRVNMGDMLMVFMRKPEHLIEKTIFLSLLDNMMVENGKIVNINEFVKAKYADRADSATKYKETADKIAREVADLKKTRSISVTKKMVDGKLEIPGLDLNNRDELQRLTNLTRRISRNATGGMSDGDINMMSMSIWTRSMMVFKNWIPKLTDTRFGEFRKVSDDFSLTIDDDGMSQGEKYDVGRLRVLGYVLNSFMAPRIDKLVSMLTMTQKGMEGYNKMYEDYKAKYEKQNGKTLNISKADFIDLMKNNLRRQVQELAILGSLIGAGFALGFMGPGHDDDKAAKNLHHYAQKVVDKFTNELSFFYNPANYEQLVSGGMFPAIGILTDTQKFLQHFWMQTTGLNLSDPTKTIEEVRKKAHPIKYLMKAAPVTKSLVTYLALFNADWAKEQDITVQRNSNMR